MELCSSVIPKKRNKVGEAVKIKIGGVGGTVVRAEAIVDGGGERSGVTGGLHIHFRVADEHAFARRGAQFVKDGVRTQRIRFFGRETIAAVNSAKIFREAEPFQNAPADADRFVREDGHWKRRKLLERFGNARVSAGGVHFVVFVVAEEILQSTLAFLFAGAAPQRASDELRRAVADVAGDGVLVQFFAAHLAEHRIDGENQVALGIDEGAVQVEDQRANGRKVRGSHKQVIVIWLLAFRGHQIPIKRLRRIHLWTFSGFPFLRVK